MAQDEAYVDALAALVARPVDRPQIPAWIFDRVAVIMAVGNNGGNWGRDYTDEEKEIWRERAKVVCFYAFRVVTAEAWADGVENMTDEQILSGEALLR